MNRVAFAAAIALVAAGAVSVQPLSGQARPRPRDAAVPFAVGETLNFDVTWSTFLTAGNAVSTVVEKRDAAGATVYHIVADGRPIPLLRRLYSVYYKMETLLDTATLLPHQTSLYSEDGGGRRLSTMRFDRARRKASYELQEDTTLKAEFDIPPQVQDGLSAVYILRAMNFKAGARITLPVADDGSLYSVHADAIALESVRVPLGTLEAWRLNVSITDAEGKPAARDAVVWISSDARRLPLKLQAELPVGHFVLLLRSVT
jgi:uncharacterized protein DUF3108